MLAREYNRLIEIWHKIHVPDGYGGNLPSDEFVKKVYAKITTNAGSKFINFGIQDFKNPVVFSVRDKKNDISYSENHFVKYQGKEFFIKGTEHKGHENMELNLLCDES
ncbi:head-tail adaptor protein [Chryseobacterium sp. G0240]|uniref:phage head closure protein n=1 Tax=Chryseobacterium sp. G0240 TaxID=2487066 RepID=UPI000F456A1A|nr:phage head closure protein [Chryseobacterium sp. G0240]ROI02939.1 head-tail adaptor protein [Chryseobacterium sp. G0240]